MRRVKFLLLIAALPFIACQKQEKININPMLHFAKVMNSADDPGNGMNPYDTIGINHNAILSEVVPLLCTNCQPDVNSATQMMLENGHLPNYKKQPFSYYDTVLRTVTADPDSLIQNGNFSPYCKQQLRNLLQLISKQAIIRANFNTQKSAIAQYETSILLNPGLPANDRKAILCASSIARYSLYFWTNSPQGAMLKLKNIVKWVAAATSDIAGGFVSGNASYAADCSSYAYWLIVYSMPE